MREALLYLLPCVYAFLACIGFSMLFNIHGAGMLICAGGGALGWLCYLLTGPLVGNDIIQSFFAALVISCWWPSFPWCQAAASTTPWNTP